MAAKDIALGETRWRRGRRRRANVRGAHRMAWVGGITGVTGVTGVTGIAWVGRIGRRRNHHPRLARSAVSLQFGIAGGAQADQFHLLLRGLQARVVGAAAGPDGHGFKLAAGAGALG